MFYKDFIKNLLFSFTFIVSFYISSAYASYVPFNTSSAGNIGIGSAAPGQKLDVAGTVRATNFIGSGAGLTGLPSSGLWNTINTNDVYEQNSSTFGNVGIGTSTTNAGAALSVMNGNVGIGTWIPSRALEVEASSSGTSLTSGSVAAIGIHNLDKTAYNFSDLAFSTLDSSNVSKLGAKISGVFTSHTSGSVSGDMAFTTMNAGTAGEKMRLTAAGNVGIGTSTPQGAFVVTNGNVGIGTWAPRGQLDVEGTLSVTTFGGNVGIGTWVPQDTLYIVTSGTSGFKSQNTNSQSTIGGAGLTGFQDDGTAMTAGNRLGFLVFGGSGDTAHSVNSNAAGITAYADGNFTTSSIPANLRFETAPTGSLTRTERMRIDSNGNVGIGTSLLAGGLVIMNGNVGIGTWVPNSALTIAGTGYVGLNLARRTDLTSTAALLTFDSSTSVWTLQNSAGSFVFYSGGTVGSQTGTERMRIDNNGNLGIGTTLTTTSGMSIMNGNVGIGTWVPKGTLDVGSAGTICLGGTCDSSWPSGTIGGLTTNYVTKAATASTLTNSIIFDNGTNVGVGSPNPGATLDVAGVISAGGSGNSYFSSGNLGVGTTTPQGAFVVTNGNVGIGTWAPALPLTVIGDTYHNGNVGIGTTITTAGAAVSVMNGNVGIGTWAPSQLMDIKGTVIIKNIIPYTASSSGSATSFAPDCSYSLYEFSTTATAGTLTANAPTNCTGQDGQLMELRVTTTNAQTWSWNSAYDATPSIALPTATGAAVYNYILFQYNSANSKWDCVATS